MHLGLKLFMDLTPAHIERQVQRVLIHTHVDGRPKIPKANPSWDQASCKNVAFVSRSICTLQPSVEAQRYYSRKYGRAAHCRIFSPTSAFSHPAKRASGNTLTSRAMVVDQSKHNGNTITEQFKHRTGRGGEAPFFASGSILEEIRALPCVRKAPWCRLT